MTDTLSQGIGGRWQTTRVLLTAIRRVRDWRQKLARVLLAQMNDRTLTAQQFDLVSDVVRSLEGLRLVLSTHPGVDS